MRVLRGCAKVRLASDLEKVLATQHDGIELQFMGESPLTGSYRTKADCGVVE